MFPCQGLYNQVPARGTNIDQVVELLFFDMPTLDMSNKLGNMDSSTLLKWIKGTVRLSTCGHGKLWQV